MSTWPKGHRSTHTLERCHNKGRYMVLSFWELLAPSAYDGNPPNQNEWVIGLVMDVRMESFPFIWKHFGDFQVKFFGMFHGRCKSFPKVKIWSSPAVFVQAIPGEKFPSFDLNCQCCPRTWQPRLLSSHLVAQSANDSRRKWDSDDVEDLPKRLEVDLTGQIGLSGRWCNNLPRNFSCLLFPSRNQKCCKNGMFQPDVATTSS